jgi:hypothetical protein
VGAVPEGRHPHCAGASPAVAVRGTGFEPADPYGTAPSTLRRWEARVTDSETGGARFKVTGVEIV